MKKNHIQILYKEIPIPPKVQIFREDQGFQIQGSLGWNSLLLKNYSPEREESFRIHSKTKKLYCLFPKMTAQAKTKFGSLKACLENQFKGVQEAYVASLSLHGLGYKAFIYYLSQNQKIKNLPRNFEKNFAFALEKNQESNLSQCLILDLGFSHIISYKLPPQIFLFIPKANTICFYGLEKAFVQQIASEVKDLKHPESYTGKGIAFLDEIIHLKAGKKS